MLPLNDPFLSWRQVEDDRPVLGVEERHEVERVGVRHQRLVVPVQGLSPVDDLVHLARRLAEHLLTHQIVVDRGHAPDDRLDGTPLQRVLGQLRTGRRVGHLLLALAMSVSSVKRVALFQHGVVLVDVQAAEDQR